MNMKRRTFFNAAIAIAIAIATVVVVTTLGLATGQPMQPPDFESGLYLGAAGLILNRANLADMTRGFQLIYQNAFDGAPSQWSQLAMEVQSSTSEEKYPWLGTTTRFREWIGDRVLQNLMSYDYTIKNKSFENTVGVDRDHIADDRLGIYTPFIKQLGLDAKQHPDELVFALIQAGFTTTCYDGQYFFDSDHPVLDAAGVAQSVSNYQSGSSSPWYLIDDTKAVKPLILQMRQPYKFVPMDKDDDEAVFSRKLFRYGVDARLNVGFGLWQIAFGSKATLDATNYEAARVAMMGMKGDNGKPLGIRPTVLVVAPTNEKKALDLLTASKLANGADNVYHNTARVVVSPWLA